MHTTDLMLEEFLIQAKKMHSDVEPIRVLRARVFKIAEANVLVRAAIQLKNQRYFFGINYVTLEEMANLDNPFIVFICGSIDKCVFVPAQLFFTHLSEISHDRNGEYKIKLLKTFSDLL